MFLNVTSSSFFPIPSPQNCMTSIKNVFPCFFFCSSSKNSPPKSHLYKDLTKESFEKLFQEVPENFLDASLKSLPLSLHIDNLNDILQVLSENLPKDFINKKKSKDPFSSTRFQLVSSFLPNFFRVVHKALNSLNSAHPPETLYEYTALVAFYTNLFSIFYQMIYALNALLGNPIHVLAIVSMTLTTALTTLHVFLNYFKKCPSSVSYCSKKIEEKTSQVIGFKDKFRKVSSHFNQVCNIALIGEPGTGKTEFMKNLPQHFSRFNVFFFDRKALSGGGGAMLRMVDRVEIALEEIYGFNDQVILCFDEIGEAIQNDQTMATLIKQGIHTRLIGTMTKEQWEDLSIELKERFRPIFFEADEDVLAIKILKHHANEASLEITDQALELLVRLTNQKKPLEAQPRKSVEAFASLLGTVAQFDLEGYKSPQLKQKQKELKQLKISNFDLSLSELENCLKKQREVKSELEFLKKENDEIILLAKTMKRYLNALKLFREKQVSLVHLFKKNHSLDKSQQEQFTFTYCYGIPTLKRLLFEIQKKLPGDIYVQLNETTVQNFFNSESDPLTA